MGIVCEKYFVDSELVANGSCLWSEPCCAHPRVGVEGPRKLGCHGISSSFFGMTASPKLI